MSGEPTLYVICGSHACRSAMLMLDHKGVAYRTVELQTGPHPVSVRLRGFAREGGVRRSVDGRRGRQLALLDRLGTVPALSIGGERVQSNHDIARHLECVRPQPPLFPSEPELRARVEEAERWGDETLQMTARRAALGASAHGLDALRARGGSGRLGPLLARNERQRKIASRSAARVFGAGEARERDVLDSIPPMLDRIDGWIGEGVLGTESPTVADFVIVPSLALMAYVPSLRAQIDARPSGVLLERLLPEPQPDAA